MVTAVDTIFPLGLSEAHSFAQFNALECYSNFIFEGKARLSFGHGVIHFIALVLRFRQQ